MAELVKFLLWLVWQLLSCSENEAKNKRQQVSYCLDYLVTLILIKYMVFVSGVFKCEKLQAVFCGDCGSKVFVTLGVASTWLW